MQGVISPKPPTLSGQARDLGMTLWTFLWTPYGLAGTAVVAWLLLKKK